MASNSIDTIYNQIGHFGTYQIAAYIYNSLSAIPSGFHNVAPVFTQATPDYRCNLNATPIQISNIRCKNSKSTTDQCYVIDAQSLDNQSVCTSFTFDFTSSPFQSTIVTDFNLVCDRKRYEIFTKMIYFFGFILGALLGGYVSDNYGRKRAQLLGMILGTIFGSMTSVTDTWWAYSILRFLLAIAMNCAYVGCFVMVMEIIGPNARTACGIFIY